MEGGVRGFKRVVFNVSGAHRRRNVQRAGGRECRQENGTGGRGLVEGRFGYGSTAENDGSISTGRFRFELGDTGFNGKPQKRRRCLRGGRRFQGAENEEMDGAANATTNATATMLSEVWTVKLGSVENGHAK